VDIHVFQKAPHQIERHIGCPQVCTTVQHANRVNIPITVQATGHGQPKTCAGGILINTANLKSVVIDSAGKKARIGAAVRCQDVIEAAHVHGLALFPAHRQALVLWDSRSAA